MTLPLLISVPHAGLEVPPEVRDACILTPEEIAADGDEGAAEIYAIEPDVTAFVTTHVARAFVDQNRSEDDRRKDGVVKTHTCWDVPVYREPLGADVVERLLARYHRPYHARLRQRAPDVVFGLDCHTMAAHGPPVGPDPNAERPPICLSNADGTCSAAAIESLAEELQRSLGVEPSINVPFQGGWIVRSHARELPWIQVEFSRAAWTSPAEKRRAFMAGVREWCRKRGPAAT